MAFLEKIFSISSETEFNTIALEMFDFQMRKNLLYAKFVDGLGRGKLYPYGNRTGGACPRPNHYTEIPYLPIEFFKSHKILINDVNTDQYFASSGTTGVNTSKHFVADFYLYEKSFTKGFEYFFGNPENYVILALLPNYLEQKHSSLIYMMNSLIKQTKSPQSGFYLNNLEELHKVVSTTLNDRWLSGVEATSQLAPRTIILFGASYALLDFAEQFPQPLENTLVFETGGMKGRRKELSKTELHNRLCKAFGVEKIYSEYGMTELLSQAYSKGENKFSCPPWMRVFTRPLNNPLGIEKHNVAGGINVIDLANYNSCPFIATQDFGKTFSDGTFEVLGRIENADVRGCSMLIENEGEACLAHTLHTL
ncbi:MAG: acyltransferase [Bacteroidales bacterium]|nr:acyltransferase [Bacteroidales bacterium]